MKTTTRARVSDEHTYMLRRERLVEHVRTFTTALTVLRTLAHVLGLEQSGPVFVVTCTTVGFTVAANILSVAARRRGTARSMKRAAPLITAIDTAHVLAIIWLLPSPFGAGEYLMLGAPIALAAMRSRLHGALAVWAATSALMSVDLLTSGAGAPPIPGGASATPLDQVWHVTLVNLVVALIVGRLAEDLHAQFDELGAQARTDALTGLANRRAFMQLLEGLARTPPRPVTLLFIDLDDFKKINDTLGHHAGDELLRIMARRLAAQIRYGDAGARLAGDEFVALLYDVEDTPALVRRVRAALEAPVTIADAEIVVPVSIGVVTGVAGVDDGEALLRRADAAMYREKDADHGVVSVRRLGPRARTEDVRSPSDADVLTDGVVSSAGADVPPGTSVAPDGTVTASPPRVDAVGGG